MVSRKERRMLERMQNAKDKKELRYHGFLDKRFRNVFKKLSGGQPESEGRKFVFRYETLCCPIDPSILYEVIKSGRYSLFDRPNFCGRIWFWWKPNELEQALNEVCDYRWGCGQRELNTLLSNVFLEKYLAGEHRLYYQSYSKEKKEERVGYIRNLEAEIRTRIKEGIV